MYESPINIAIDNMVTQMEHDRESLIIRSIYTEGIDVDKNELIKALQYDRNQYQKGFEDCARSMRLDVLDKIRAEIEQMPSELTDDGRRMIRRGKVFRIIDKYKAESEDKE